MAALDLTVLHLLLPLMKAMKESGHEVVGVCSPGPAVSQIEAAGFEVEVIPFTRRVFSLAHVRTYRQLVRLFRGSRFDIVHVHTPVAALLGRLAAARAGVPTVVYTAHGFFFHDRMASWKRLLMTAVEWIGGRFTDLMLSVSAEDAAYAKRWKLSRGPIEWIGNGADPRRFAPSGAVRQRMRQDLGIAEEEVVVLSVGRLVAEKGFPELVAAMRSIEATLIVAGGRLESAHAPWDENLVHGDNVRFLGYRTDVPDLMRCADIFVLASHREGMPLSIIEAMHAHLPVVATNIRGSREEVVDGETGLLVRVNDRDGLASAIKELTGDERLRRAMGEAGAARAAELYDQRTVIDRQLRLLKLV